MSKIIPQSQLTAYTQWQLPPMEGFDEVEPPAPHQPAQSEQAGPEQAAKPEKAEPQVAFPTAEEIEEMQRQAQEEGFAAGYREGMAKAEQDIAVQVRAFGQLMATLSEPLADLDQEVEQELVALTTAIARQMIRRELKTSPGEIVAVVREAVAALPVTKRSVHVYLHPEDARLIREVLALSEDEERPWKIVEEPVLTRGGCRVITETSHVDATVEKRLAAVIATMMGTERERTQS